MKRCGGIGSGGVVLYVVNIILIVGGKCDCYIILCGCGCMRSGRILLVGVW